MGALIRKGALIGRRALNRIITVVFITRLYFVLFRGRELRTLTAMIDYSKRTLIVVTTVNDLYFYCITRNAEFSLAYFWCNIPGMFVGEMLYDTVLPFWNTATIEGN